MITDDGAAPQPAWHPYRDLAPEQFWSKGVAAQEPSTIVGLYTKKFDISPDDRIGTAGSCFAQHIARHLRESGYKVLDVEPPAKGMRRSTAQKFGYSIYSARYGNIYTVRHLVQLLEEALGSSLRDGGIAWKKDGRFYDALRPTVEPKGFESAEEVLLHRKRHLERVLNLFRQVDVLIFTLGLTEAWVDRRTGTVYPTCPGTTAGTFDPELYVFKNFTFDEIYDDFCKFRFLLQSINPHARFLVTVSPVPLVATATNSHVLVATTYSKSTLRSVAGRLYDEFPDVDYFPSYEIISSPWTKGAFFEKNLRDVTPKGVATVMRIFSLQHPPAGTASRDANGHDAAAEALVCDEELLQAFAR